MENNGVGIDLYDLIKNQAYFKEGKENDISQLNLFILNNPFKGKYVILNGFNDVIKSISNFRFTKEYIDNLRKTGLFSEDFLEYLENFKFEGEINVLKDDNIIIPYENIISIKASVMEIKIFLSIISSYINYSESNYIAIKTKDNIINNVCIINYGIKENSLSDDNTIDNTKDDIYIEILRKLLKQYNISNFLYSLNGYAEERICIEKVNGLWECYCVVRGHKEDLKIFDNPNDACLEVIKDVSPNLTVESDIINDYLDEIQKVLPDEIKKHDNMNLLRNK